MRRLSLIALAGILVAAASALPLSTGADALPATTPHYPDLVTKAPYGLRISGKGSGRKLFFSNTIGNIGNGPLELRPVNNASTGTTDAIQEIYTHTGPLPRADVKPPRGNLTLVSSSTIGTFVFHPAHSHWHMEDFANYGLYAINTDGTTGALLKATEKVSFCMIDTDTIDSTLEHYNWGMSHSCGQSTRQGVKVGKGDTYSSSLPDQYIDITGVTNGTYRLVSVADPTTAERPGGRLLEVNNSNNAASVDITITGGSVTIISGSAHEGFAMSAGASDTLSRMAVRPDVPAGYCEVAARTAA